MPDIEELEHRLTRLESFYEDVLKDKLTALTARFDRVDARLDQLDTRINQLYEKTERDKTELISKIADVLIKTERDKRELIYWMVGLNIGFLTLTITAIWAILSFALKQ